MIVPLFIFPKEQSSVSLIPALTSGFFGNTTVGVCARKQQNMPDTQLARAPVAEVSIKTMLRSMEGEGEHFNQAHVCGVNAA